MPQLSVAFVGADSGTWSIERLVTVSGEPLASASRLEGLEGSRAARPALSSRNQCTGCERRRKEVMSSGSPPPPSIGDPPASRDAVNQEGPFSCPGGRSAAKPPPRRKTPGLRARPSFRTPHVPLQG